MERSEFLREQASYRDRWKLLFRWWNRIYYLLAITAIASSTLVASRPQFLSPDLYSLVAWSTALATGLAAFLKPEERAFRYRRAWSMLSIALIRYMADEASTVEPVLAAFEQGDNLIHETPWKISSDPKRGDVGGSVTLHPVGEQGCPRSTNERTSDRHGPRP
jgi:hypothetical protein